VTRNPRRYFLKEKETKKLLINISQKFKEAERLFGVKPHIEVKEVEGAEIFIVNGKPLLARFGDMLFPTLAFEQVFPFLPRIVVDMGAVSHLCNGADVMAPGVTSIQGDFGENDFLIIVDQRHGKPLAIGVTLFNSQTMKNMKQGKIVKNIHHVGDKLWKLIRETL
jgi:PUA domain protein